MSSPVPQSHCGRRLRAVPGRQRKRPTYDSPFHPACRGKGNHGNMFSRLPPVVVPSHHYNSYSSRSASQERPLGGAPSERPQKDPQSGPGAPKPKTHQCCSKLILERPRLRSAHLGASLGFLGLPGRLLGPPVAKLGKNLFPHAHPPQQTSLCNHVWSARAKHAIYEKHPGLDEKRSQVDMDLACDPDKTAFAISSLIHGPDLL